MLCLKIICELVQLLCRVNVVSVLLSEEYLRIDPSGVEDRCCARSAVSEEYL